MGNVGSNNNSNGRRRHGGGGSRRENNQNHPTPPPQQPPPEINTNQIVFTAATPYPNIPPQPYNQYPTGVNYQPPPPLPMAAPLPPAQAWVGGRYPCAPVMHHPTPYTDHQKAETMKNDVNLKKETLKIEPDEQHPGKLLVEFTFNATVSGSIIIYFFAKESEDCNMTPIDSFPPITIEFQQGLNQKFKQESGTGIDLSTFEESEITKVCETGVYPLAIKAEATPSEEHKSTNSQITLAVFEKDKGVYHVKVVKQMLWVNGMRYELQEIYGIGNSVDSAADFDGNDSGKECVICLSEPRDTTVLPCRHMCMCSGCAKLMRFQTTKCPICRQPVERLLEIKVSSGVED